MRLVRRTGSALALLWYLGLGFGIPLVDALVFHDQEQSLGAHIESSDAECHRAECSLEAPGAPQSPAGDPVGTPRIAVARHVEASARPAESPRVRSPARAHAPRAPPASH